MSTADQPRRLQLPLTEADARSLKAGDIVTLHGEVIITAGLPTHQRMMACLEKGEPLPYDFEGQALLHLGGYSQLNAEGQFELLYLNPTTSTRFNPYMPTLIRQLGLRITGGKGGLDDESAKVMQEQGCVYLSFIGGGCTVLSESIREIVAVAWEDMLTHYRLVKVRVDGLGPATVGIDAHGNSLYSHGIAEAKAHLPQIMADLKAARDAAPSAVLPHA